MMPQQAMMNDALPPHTPSPLLADTDATVTGTDIVYLADLQPQPVEWLWQHRLAAGTLAMLSGEQGSGKTWVALAIAAALTCGRDPFTGEKLKPATVLYVSAEHRPTGAGLPKRKFAAQWLRDCLQPGSQTQGSIEVAAERDGVCIATLRRAKFDIGVRNSKDGKSGAWWWKLPPPEDEYPPVNEARCSNELLEHLEHLHETNDLFGNVAKSQNLRRMNAAFVSCAGTMRDRR